MRFQHIIEQVYYQPWFITPEGHAAVSRLVENRLLRSAQKNETEDLMSLLVRKREDAQIDGDGIGYVQDRGKLRQHRLQAGRF
jgi:hypothetical protein